MIERNDEMVEALLRGAEGTCVCGICARHRIAAVLAIAERQWQERYGDAFQAGWWRGQHELCPRCGVALEREVREEQAQRFEVVTWDWREQPDWRAIGAALTRLFGDGVHMAWPETGSDQYAVVMSDQPFTAEQAAAAYRAGGAS